MKEQELLKEWRESELSKQVDSALPLILSESVARYWLSKREAELKEIREKIEKLTIYEDYNGDLDCIKKKEVLSIIDEKLK
jgi:hypothetical protein